MAAGTGGFLQLGWPTAPGKNKFIGTCLLTGTIPAGWTVDQAPFSTLSAGGGSGNAGTFVWDSSEDDTTFSDSGTFTNSGKFEDDAKGFTQSIAVGNFVNTGTVLSNSTGMWATGTTATPTCPTCTFVDDGIVQVNSKATFASASVFELGPDGTIDAPGDFDIANASTFDVLGGSVTAGTLVTGQFLGQAPSTIEFAPTLPAGSKGRIDIATSSNLHGVIPKHWTINNTGGSIFASNAGNAGTFVWSSGIDDSTFSDSTPFINSGSFSDDATGFNQAIEMSRFVNTGTMVSNAPGFSVAGPTGVKPVFVDSGTVLVGPGAASQPAE